MLITDHFNKNLGTYNQALHLLTIVANTPSPRIVDLQKFCSDISIEWTYSFLGSLALLEFLNYFEIEDGIFTTVTSEGNGFLNLPEEEKRFELIKTLWDNLIARELLLYVFRSVRFTFDVIHNAISFFRHEIPPKFSALRNFLIDIEFFETKQSNRLFIGQGYSQYFEQNILPALSMITMDSYELYSELNLDCGISYEMLQNRLAIQTRLGDEAEFYVLRLEQSKFADHPLHDRIKIISKIDVAAGYDIVSLKDSESKSVDNFIEVKSFSRNHRFYWSQNEISVAKIKGDDYCLCLVDRSRISETEYKPTIIQNPYKTIFENDEFIKFPESYQIHFPPTIT